MEKVLKQIQMVIIWGLIILLPVFVLNVFADPIILPKMVLLAVGVGVLLILFAIEIIVKGKLEFKSGSFDLGVLLLAAAYVISAIARTPNKMEAFFYPGVATIFVVSALLYFLINQVKNKTTIYALIGSAIALSIFTLLPFLGVFEKIPGLPAFMKSNNFSFAGDFVTVAVVLAATVPLVVYLLVTLKDAKLKFLSGLCLVLIVPGLAFSLFNIFTPGKATLLAIPDSFTSRVVALEALKENSLLGVGPGNYLSAFSKFRPLAYNYTPLWANKFASAGNFYFTLITEAGLLGLAAMGVLLLQIVRRLRSRAFTLVSLLIILVAIAFIPASFLTIVMLFVMLAINAQTHSWELTLSNRSSKAPAVIVGLVLLVIVGFVGIKAGGAIAAEVTYKRAFDVLNNRGSLGQVYDLLQRAINQNSQVDRYHAAYAQINIEIVRSITNTNNKKQLTDEEKRDLAQLVSQAIREAQVTVALNPERAVNWEVLARIYQALIPVAKDAEQLAIQAFNETTKFDPINPNLRIVLGGIYYAKGDWERAIETFRLAVVAKNDLANAHYNLAAAYRENGDVARAMEEMEIVLKIVPKDSSDYKLASNELENLKKKSPPAQGEGETLIPPQPQEPAAITPQVELPKE